MRNSPNTVRCRCSFVVFVSCVERRIDRFSLCSCRVPEHIGGEVTRCASVVYGHRCDRLPVVVRPVWFWGESTLVSRPVRSDAVMAPASCPADSCLALLVLLHIMLLLL